MPVETTQAIEWALTQTVVIDPDFNIAINVTKETSMELVDKVREYFNANNVEYNTFSYDDLLPYLETV